MDLDAPILSSGFPTRFYLNQPAQLHRLPRELKLRWDKTSIPFFDTPGKAFHKVLPLRTKHFICFCHPGQNTPCLYCHPRQNIPYHFYYPGQNIPFSGIFSCKNNLDNHPTFLESDDRVHVTIIFYEIHMN